jgi:hypothetical protein
MRENEGPLVSNDCGTNTVSGTISFRVLRVVKDAKGKRANNIVEKKAGTKKKKYQKKGNHRTHHTMFHSHYGCLHLFSILILFIYFICLIIGEETNIVLKNRDEGADPTNLTTVRYN